MCFARERADQLLEDASAMLVILELVEAGAGRRQQNRVAGLRVFGGECHGAVQRSRAFDGNHAAELRLDLFRGAPISSTMRARAAGLAQERVVAAFVLAAENHQQPPGNASRAFSVASTLVALESLKYSTPEIVGDEFEPVLDAGEAAHARGDRRRLDADQYRGRGRGQNIFHIVLAAQADVAVGAAERSRAIAAENDLVVAQKAPLATRFCRLNQNTLRPRGRVLRCRPDRRRSGRRRRPRSDFRKCAPWRGVGFERTVAVEMIGRQIEQHGDVRAECGDRFELKAADFDDGDARVARSHPRAKSAACRYFRRPARAIRRFRECGRPATWWWSCRSSR